MTTDETTAKIAELTDALLDIKRWAGKSDNAFEPWDLLDPIHDRALAALGQKQSPRCPCAERHDMSTETTNKIAELNDLCRKAMGIAGRLVQTPGICALPQTDQSAIREKVETFAAFTEGNDPHGERDFGALDHNGQRIFWKIDYYNTNLMNGSEDPSDPKQTVRVLTIMLASEY